MPGKLLERELTTVMTLAPGDEIPPSPAQNKKTHVHEDASAEPKTHFVAEEVSNN